MTEEDIKVGVELDISSISKAMDELISLSSSVKSVIVKLQNYALAAAMILAEGEVVKCAEKYLSAWPITRWYWKRKLFKAKAELDKIISFTDNYLTENKNELQKDSERDSDGRADD